MTINIFLRYQKDLKAYAISLCGDEQNGADLTQETYLKAWKGKEKLQSHTNIKAWLFTIMRNTFINNYRRQKQFYKYLDEQQKLPFQSQGYCLNNAESNLRLDNLNEKMNRIDHQLLKPFKAYVDGYKYKEISENMRLPLGTVKSRIHLAKNAIKRELTANEIETANAMI